MFSTPGPAQGGLCPRARRGLQKPAKRCSPSMAHGALYARYSPATVAEAPAWAFAPAPCPLEKTKPRALYWRRGPPPVPVHALVWPPPRGAESAHILLVLCSLCEARRRCYALTGTLGNSYTHRVSAHCPFVLCSVSAVVLLAFAPATKFPPQTVNRCQVATCHG